MKYTVNEKPDFLLLEDLRKDNQQAFLQIYDRYYDALFFYASKGIKDSVLVEDILQETFLYLWEKRKTLKINYALNTYLYTIVRYKIFTQIKENLKKESKLIKFIEQSQHEFEVTPLQIIEQKEVLFFLYYKLDELPQKCKEVFIMSRLDQLSHKEIAEKLQISTKTVENHITKAQKILKISAKIITLYLLTK